MKQYQIRYKNTSGFKRMLADVKMSCDKKPHGDIIFYITCHDIRTPMNAIMGYTSLIDKCIDDKKKILDYLGKINVAGNTLLELVNQVLDMSRIESETWKGTKISVILSFRLAQPGDSRPDTDRRISGSVSLRGKRVLLVEDNEMNREIATMLLKDMGLVVDTAEDGDIAVGIIRQLAEKGEWKYYDFILMDVQMPRMTGYSATTAIRTISDPGGVHIPIIAMMANAFVEDKRTALAAGMDDHIAKPIDARVLRETLTKYI